MSFTIDLSNPVVYNSLFLISIPIFAILSIVYYRFINFIFRYIMGFFIEDDYCIEINAFIISMIVVCFQFMFLVKIIFG